MKTLRDENVATKHALAEEKLSASMRRLSEATDIDITADDGTVAKGRSNGIAPVVLAEARKRILEDFSLQEPIMALLDLFQRTGAVPLGEHGVGRSTDEHDPVATTSLSDEDPDGAKWTLREQNKATSAGKVWTALSGVERQGYFLLTEDTSKRRTA